jgi:hypothetical protein
MVGRASQIVIERFSGGGRSNCSFGNLPRQALEVGKVGRGSHRHSRTGKDDEPPLSERFEEIIR